MKRGEWQDEVRIRVPRCSECRVRSRVAVAMTFVSAIVGAIVTPFVWSRFWPDVDALSGLHTGGSGLRGAAPGIGLVLGFVVGLLGMALQGRILGLQPLTTYPYVIRLRQQGWHFPASSGD